jgi:hypothetical protein
MTVFPVQVPKKRKPTRGALARASVPTLRRFTEGRRDMKNSPITWPMLLTLVSSLVGCVTGGTNTPEGSPHLSATQCSDLAALKNNEPLTRERNRSELAALMAAGYDPLRFDPYYPNDLQAAQRQVDRWYQQECRQARPG